MIARLLTSPAARVVITAAILVLLLRDVSLAHILAALTRVDPLWFAAGLALVTADRALMIVRWRLLLRSAGVVLSRADAIRIFLVSSFVGSFLPAGVGGDAARAYAVTARTEQGGEAVASVAIDRLLGMAALVGLGAVGLVGWAQHLAPALRWRLTAASLAVGLLMVASLWTDALVRAWLPDRLRATKWGWRVARLGEAVGRYRQRGGTLAVVLALSVAVQVMRVLQGYSMGRGIGVTVGLAYYLVFMPVGLLMMLLPISVSGFGLPQGVIVWMLQPVGVPAEEAFALSTLILVLGLIGNLPGAFLYLRRTKSVT